MASALLLKVSEGGRVVSRRHGRPRSRGSVWRRAADFVVPPRVLLLAPMEVLSGRLRSDVGVAHGAMERLFALQMAAPVGRQVLLCVAPSPPPGYWAGRGDGRVGSEGWGWHSPSATTHHCTRGSQPPRQPPQRFRRHYNTHYTSAAPPSALGCCNWPTAHAPPPPIRAVLRPESVRPSPASHVSPLLHSRGPHGPCHRPIGAGA
jgi:hypothetical protein